jgi:uncharacterized protein involved in outer membrane biogenesis
MRLPPVPRSRSFRVAAVAVALVAIYGVLGFAIAPGILRSQAKAFVRQHYRRELRVGDVRFNPFLLKLEIRDLSLPDAGGEPMLGFARLVVDVEVSSIWHRALVFQEITLEAPQVHAVVRPEGGLNVAELALPPDPAAPPEPEGPPPALWIEALTVSRGTVSYLDDARQPPLSRTFDDVGFALRDFRTTPQGGEFRFSAGIQGDGSFTWSGRFALAPVLSSEGDFQVAGLRVPGVAELAGDAVPFVVAGGTVDLGGHYRVALGPVPSVELELPSVVLRNLALRARGESEDVVRLPTLTVAGTRASLGSRSAKVESVTLEGLAVHVLHAADGSVNLQRLVPVSAGEAPAAAAPAQPWTFTLGTFEVKDAAVDVEDRAPATPARFLLHVNARAGDLSLDLARPVPVSLSLGLDGGGSLDVSGKVTPQPLAADLTLKLAALPLRAFQPYVAGAAALTVTSGELGVQGTVAMRGTGLDVSADVDVSSFDSVDDALHERFVGFSRLQLSGLHSTSQALTIDRVLLKRPYARAVIGADQTMNLTAVRRPSPPSKEPAAEPITLRIGQVRIDRGRVSFTDHFVQGGFAAEMEDLSGTITSVSSSARARTRIDLTGHVNDAPITIKGELQPFGFARYTDVSLSLANVELPLFNPYSGPVAGYNIARGKLGTEIHYRIMDRRLAAEHRVRVDGLEWGNATDTKGEATLPLRFATSLLKDKDGVIALELPVEGTLDDPSFRVGPVVWQVFKNLLVKAATAPFALLGSVFAGAEAAQFVDFAPGSAELPPSASTSLAALSHGLSQRPGLRLDVPIGVLPELDRPALIERALDVLLAGAPASSSGRIVALTALVRKRTGVEPKIPAPPPAAEGATPAAARALREDTALAFLERAARAAVTVPDADLESLAQARARAVERALAAGGVDPARIFQVREGKVSTVGGQVRFELQLE